MTVTIQPDLAECFVFYVSKTKEYWEIDIFCARFKTVKNNRWPLDGEYCRRKIRGPVLGKSFCGILSVCVGVFGRSKKRFSAV